MPSANCGKVSNKSITIPSVAEALAIVVLVVLAWLIIPFSWGPWPFFLVITLSVLAANFLADLAYMALDPRTRREG